MTGSWLWTKYPHSGVDTRTQHSGGGRSGKGTSQWLNSTLQCSLMYSFPWTRILSWKVHTLGLNLIVKIIGKHACIYLYYSSNLTLLWMFIWFWYKLKLNFTHYNPVLSVCKTLTLLYLTIRIYMYKYYLLKFKSWTFDGSLVRARFHNIWFYLPVRLLDETLNFRWATHHCISCKYFKGLCGFQMFPLKTRILDISTLALWVSTTKWPCKSSLQFHPHCHPRMQHFRISCVAKSESHLSQILMQVRHTWLNP